MSPPRFVGFGERMTFVPVPAPFFGPLLRDVDNLGELKLTLHVWRLLRERRDGPRLVRRSELTTDRQLLLALRTEDPAAPERALADALASAVARATLLEVPIRDGDAEDLCYLLNTGPNRRLVADVQRGQRRLGPFEAVPRVHPVEVGGPEGDRPSIFELYEQNVGLLTPILAEELREAELTYPRSWVEEAFREAVVSNKRSWRYIRRILESWAARGRGTEQRGQDRRRPEPPKDWREYLRDNADRLARR